jgi:hypothetical protein
MRLDKRSRATRGWANSFLLFERDRQWPGRRWPPRNLLGLVARRSNLKASRAEVHHISGREADSWRLQPESESSRSIRSGCKRRVVGPAHCDYCTSNRLSGRCVKDRAVWPRPDIAVDASRRRHAKQRDSRSLKKTSRFHMRVHQGLGVDFGAGKRIAPPICGAA